MPARTKPTPGTSEPPTDAVPSTVPGQLASQSPPGAADSSGWRTPSEYLARARHVGDLKAVPAQWRSEVNAVLINELELRRRVSELARALTREYVGKDLIVIALLTGTVMFLSDLLRRLTMPLRLDFMGVSSYREGTVSRELAYTKELRLEVKGRDVLLVDDILDTGRTLAAVLGKLAKLKPASVRTCVLLDKPSRRVEKVDADYVGFVIPDLFVVGYGLDYRERYRNLPFVGVLRPELYRLP